MNGAFLHIASNHIPVVGVPFCVILLGIGVLRKNPEILKIAFGFLVLMAVVTIFVYKTGGPAAHVLSTYPGVIRFRIHEHAEAGEDVFWAVEALGAAALVGFWLLRRGGKALTILNVLLLLGGLWVSMWLGWVAHLGGVIRHPEISTDAPPTAMQTPNVPPAR